MAAGSVELEGGGETFPTVASALPLSRPSQRDEAGADGRARICASGAISAASRDLSRRARRWRRSGSARSAICPSAISPPASAGARRSPGCWSATGRSGCSTSRPRGSTRRRSAVRGADAGASAQRRDHRRRDAPAAGAGGAKELRMDGADAHPCGRSLRTTGGGRAIARRRITSTRRWRRPSPQGGGASAVPC